MNAVETWGLARNRGLVALTSFVFAACNYARSVSLGDLPEDRSSVESGERGKAGAGSSEQSGSGGEDSPEGSAAASGAGDNGGGGAGARGTGDEEVGGKGSTGNAGGGAGGAGNAGGGGLEGAGGAGNAGAGGEGSDALLGHWELDDGDGAIAADSSGSDNDGVIVGEAQWIDGRNGGALSLRGTGYVVMPNEVIDSSLSYTVATWVRLNSTAGWRTLISQDGVGASAFYLQLDDQSDTFSLNICATRDASCVAGPDKISAQSTTQPTVDTWYHVAGVHDLDEIEIRVYVNGTLEKRTPHPRAWRGDGAMVLGRAKYGGSPVDFVDGALDGVRAYQRALSTSEIRGLYEGGR